MKLKEAYRYSNFLSSVYDSLVRNLHSDDFITTTVEKHMRSKSNPEAQDETITIPKATTTDATVAQMLDLLVSIIDERMALSEAISEAKDAAGMDIDVSLAMNKWLRSAIGTLTYMSRLKPKSVIKSGSGYKFDADGRQTNYYYDKEVVTTIDYDRENVRKLLRKYQNQCDEISSQVESIEINVNVDFEPKYDLHSSLDELLAL